MYGLLTKLLLRGNLAFKPCEIVAFDDHFLLLNVRSLKYLTDSAEKNGIRGITDLYLAGWYYGIYTTKGIIKAYNLKKFEERYKVVMDLIGVLGMGDYKTLVFQRGVNSKFNVIETSFSKLYYPSKDEKFVCHYIRGIEAGGGTLVHEALMNNIEHECAAINGAHCVHENLNRERILNIDKSILAKQIDLDYAIEKERDILIELGYDPKLFGYS